MAGTQRREIMRENLDHQTKTRRQGDWASVHNVVPRARLIFHAADLGGADRAQAGGDGLPGDAHLGGGSRDADGDLAAVGDQQVLDGHDQFSGACGMEGSGEDGNA